MDILIQPKILVLPTDEVEKAYKSVLAFEETNFLKDLMKVQNFIEFKKERKRVELSIDYELIEEFIFDGLEGDLGIYSVISYSNASFLIECTSKITKKKSIISLILKGPLWSIFDPEMVKRIVRGNFISYKDEVFTRRDTPCLYKYSPLYLGQGGMITIFPAEIDDNTIDGIFSASLTFDKEHSAVRAEIERRSWSNTSFLTILQTADIDISEDQIRPSPRGELGLSALDLSYFVSYFDDIPEFIEKVRDSIKNLNSFIFEINESLVGKIEHYFSPRSVDEYLINSARFFDQKFFMDIMKKKVEDGEAIAIRIERMGEITSSIIFIGVDVLKNFKSFYIGEFDDLTIAIDDQEIWLDEVTGKDFAKGIYNSKALELNPSFSKFLLMSKLGGNITNA